jgi:predicted kinase
MELFEALCPTGPQWTLDWAAVREAFGWVRALEGVPQDAIHHAEGDVATHTRMAAEALIGLPEWRARSAAERTRLFAAVLLHDVAKPYCTRHEPDGRITAAGHSRRGDLMVRRILWESGAPIAWREHVAALVRHHQVPFWALERPDLDAIVFRCSLVASNDDLAVLATADILGRVCTDADGVLDNIALFREYCAERRCLHTPRAFASDHARFSWFRTPGRDPDYAPYEQPRCTVTILSGLPGAGKDTWIAAHRADLPVVSLDALRTALGVRPTDGQGPVIDAARTQAREHLRARRSFVWNATNLSKQLRDRCTGLAADYDARVEVVSLEAPPEVIRRRNGSRAHPVPDAVIDRMADRWETPDLTEAHTVSWIRT